MQRPKKLDERMEIRLSKNDKATIAQHAREAGLTPAAWVRLRLRLDRPAAMEAAK